jgi:hypothetical protein
MALITKRKGNEGHNPLTGDREMGCGRFLWGVVPPRAAMSLCLERHTRCWVQHKFPAVPCCFQAFLGNGLVSTVFSQMTPFFNRAQGPTLPRCSPPPHAHLTSCPNVMNRKPHVTTNPFFSTTTQKPPTMAALQQWVFPIHKHFMGLSDRSLDSESRSFLLSHF